MDPTALQKILLSLANERSIDALLNTIVESLAKQDTAALARIWMVEEGEPCDDQPTRTGFLKLVASDGSSLDPNADRWRRLNGDYSRMKIGERKVGEIAATGRPIFLANLGDQSDWMRDPEWGERERIRSFAGQPLIFRGETLGVLALFSRKVLSPEMLHDLQSFADHAAAAYTNARAFEEIDCLKNQLALENEYLREEVLEVNMHGEILGDSSALNKVLEQIELVAPTDSGVLIEGESGTGKELIARAIHDRSKRSARAMIKVNCASVPKELFESEFFGHVRGAFTGAIKDRTGRFELADGGTLFLDEVGEIPLDLQGKLLRVLQESEFERVGEDRTRSADVRIIAATNKNLKEEVDNGTFRQDLFFRLSVFPVSAPALRERCEDIPLLTSHFLTRAAARLGMPEPILKQRHILQLQQYEWPGNIRELQNVVERAVITAQHGPLHFDVPGGELPDEATSESSTHIRPTEPTNDTVLTAAEIREYERANLLRALEEAKWKISGKGGAAKLLGAKPSTVSSRIKALRIQKP